MPSRLPGRLWFHHGAAIGQGKLTFMAKAKWTKKAGELTTIPLDQHVLAEALQAAYEEGKHDAFHPKEKVNVTYGWVSPDPKELSDFEDMLNNLILHRFGKDGDGDCPVRLYLLDRTRYEPVSWYPVPRDITDDDHHPYKPSNWNETTHTEIENLAYQRAIRDNKSWRVRMIGANLESAHRIISDYMRLEEYEIRKADEAIPNQVKKRIRDLEAIKEKWESNPDPFSFYEDDKHYTLDREARTYSYTATMGKNKGKIVTWPISEKPANFDELMLELAQLQAWEYPKPLDWSRVAKIPY